MALLNLKKFKKDKGEPKAEVPDELPSLPGDKKEEAKPAEEKPAEGQKPAEATPTEEKSKGEPKKEEEKPAEEKKKEQGLAPDELPPISKEAASATQLPAPVPPSTPAPPQTAVEPQAAQSSSEVSSQQKTDEKLYFSELISRFHDKGMQQDVEKELIASASGEVISHLNAQWEDQKQLVNLSEFDQRIVGSIKPLENLEEEWRALKEEIYSKNKKIKEIEHEIKEKSVEVKKLIQSKNKLKTQIGKKKGKQAG